MSKATIATMNNAKLNKILTKTVKIKNISTTWGKYLESNTPKLKGVSIQEYSNKKVCLEYKKLKTPKTFYWVEFEGAKGGLIVPKLLYDHVKAPLYVRVPLT